MQPKPIRAVYNTPMRRFLLLCSWLTNEFAKFTNRQNQSVRYAFYYVYVCPTSAHQGFWYGYRQYKSNIFTLKATSFGWQSMIFKVQFNIIKYKNVKEIHFLHNFSCRKVCINDHSKSYWLILRQNISVLLLQGRRERGKKIFKEWH